MFQLQTDCAFPQGVEDGVCAPHFHFLCLVFWASPLPPMPDEITASLPQVYCSGMQTDSPKEYVTLVNGDAENFSEVYGYR